MIKSGERMSNRTERGRQELPELVWSMCMRGPAASQHLAFFKLAPLVSLACCRASVVDTSQSCLKRRLGTAISSVFARRARIAGRLSVLQGCSRILTFLQPQEGALYGRKADMRALLSMRTVVQLLWRGPLRQSDYHVPWN